MNKKSIIVVLLAALCVVQMVALQPFPAPFFGMSFGWQALYALLMCGYPVLLLIPIALLTAPLAFLFKGNKGFKLRWKNFTENVFLFFAVIIFLVNTLLLVSKYLTDHDPFPLTKYDEVEGFKGNTDDIRTGEFEGDHGSFTRYEDKEISIDDNNDTLEYSVKWISSSEFQLVYLGENQGMQDTIYVRITNNTSDFYECYGKFGEYADYQKIWKK